MGQMVGGRFFCFGEFMIVFRKFIKIYKGYVVEVYSLCNEFYSLKENKCLVFVLF